MSTMSSPNSRTNTFVSFILAFALTASLLVFPSAAIPKPAPLKSGTLVGAASIASASHESTVATEARAQDAYGKLGLQFEANHGQTDEQVKFLARGAGYTLFLTPTQAVFALRNSECGLTNNKATLIDAQRSSNDSQSANCNSRSAVLRMRVEGANPSADVQGMDKLPGIVNYFIGSESSKWHTDIPTFERVGYSEIYSGVDLIYYGNQQQLEYDFIIKPGAQPQQVSLAFEGADSVEVEAATGDLLLKVGKQTVKQHKPFVYQETEGERHEIESRYEMRSGGRVGFHVGSYDPQKPLVIDPVLVYSTYLGGGNNDQGNGIAVDSARNAYITGITFSANFPTTSGVFDTSLGGTSDAFVTKLNGAGTARVYSTYLGGTGDESSNSIAVDSFGSAYVTGQTGSNNFPTAIPIQAMPGNSIDGFVAKLNETGSFLIYSTYLGGNNGDSGFGIKVDSAGNAFVTGQTSSTNFPTVNPMQATAGGGGDAFVTKINALGSAFIYSTYLGGSGSDSGNGIAIDSAGNAYISGSSFSLNFPAVNAVQPTRGGSQDGVAVKINAAGTALVYSTYLGGTLFDTALSIAVDPSGSAYVTGQTTSTNFPITPGAFQSMLSGDADSFVTKLSPLGSTLVYSTYLGGRDTGGSSTGDRGFGIAVDSSGSAYVTGTASSADFPTTPGAFQSALSSVCSACTDAFVARLNAPGSALAYSTYLGGSGVDSGRSISIDSVGNAYVTGGTSSTDFPTVNPMQPILGSTANNSDAFIAKVISYSIAGHVVDSSANPLSGVTMTLSGSNSFTTQTDANGNFVFLTTTPGGEYNITPFRDGFTFSPETIHIFNLDGNRDLLFIGTGSGPSPTPTPSPTSSTFQFSTASFAVDEDGGKFQVIVTRSGNTSQPQTVDYETTDGTANDRDDYTTAIGRLRFAAGETARSFDIFITDDVYAEGNETIQITLSNPSAGAQLGGMTTTLLTIVDNDLITAATNPIDQTAFFVRQHYVDFFGRDPDGSGLAFWANNIDSCGANAACRSEKRTDTSAAFFLSIEFQQTGFVIHRAVRAAFNRFPRFREFIRDNRELGRDVIVGQGAWEAQLEANKQAYFDEFVTRAEFVSIYGGLTNEQYVDALNANTNDSLSSAERNGLVAGLNGASETRATVLRKVAEDADFIARERNPAFVLAQYFGYLRRNPDDAPDTNFSGFDFWLAKLNEFGGDFRRAEMVKSFLVSTEYRRRFGP